MFSSFSGECNVMGVGLHICVVKSNGCPFFLFCICWNMWFTTCCFHGLFVWILLIFHIWLKLHFVKNVEVEAHLLNWANTVSKQNKASDRGKWPLLKDLLLLDRGIKMNLLKHLIWDFKYEIFSHILRCFSFLFSSINFFITNQSLSTCGR